MSRVSSYLTFSPLPENRRLFSVALAVSLAAAFLLGSMVAQCCPDFPLHVPCSDSPGHPFKSFRKAVTGFPERESTKKSRTLCKNNSPLRQSHYKPKLLIQEATRDLAEETEPPLHRKPSPTVALVLAKTFRKSEKQFCSPPPPWVQKGTTVLPAKS